MKCERRGRRIFGRWNLTSGGMRLRAARVDKRPRTRRLNPNVFRTHRTETPLSTGRKAGEAETVRQNHRRRLIEMTNPTEAAISANDRILVVSRLT